MQEQRKARGKKLLPIQKCPDLAGKDCREPQVVQPQYLMEDPRLIRLDFGHERFCELCVEFRSHKRDQGRLFWKSRMPVQFLR